jgi:TfoX/Sxy family transcriptional regulator of competence genes
VYVTVEGGGFHNPETAAQRLEVSEKYLQEIERELEMPGRRTDDQAWRHKAQLERQIEEARRVLADLKRKLG